MAAFIPNELYGIIGLNLGHTMSPLMHNTGFQALGHPGVMMTWSFEPEKMESFIKSMRLLNIRGCSVTIPHKVGVLPFLERPSDRVKMIGACNTLHWDGDVLCGENTDVLGFLSPLETETLPATAKVLVLGAGGAGRAVVAGLKMKGLTDITITDIVDTLPDTLAKDFNLKRVGWDDRFKVDADFIVNVTPLGMTGKFLGQSAYSLDAFKERKSGLAYDVVYNPAATQFQTDAKQAGWRVISGQTMFIAQGNHQFKLWTGKDLPKEAIEAVKNRLLEMAAK